MSRFLFLRAFLGACLLFCLASRGFAASDLPAVGQGQRILFITSNQHTYGTTKISAANHFEEIVMAYDVFKKNGYQVDFVSPEGGAIPLGYMDTSNAIQKQHLYDAAFMNLLKNTLRPDQVSASAYQAVYYSGGGSAMFGVAENKAIQQLAVSIHERGGVVSAICHGTAGIVNLKDRHGVSLIAGRNITGFPDMFEDTKAAYFKAFPFSIDKEITKNGGKFVYSEKWAANYFVVDNRIVTGQDPSATVSVAEEVIKAIQGAKRADALPMLEFDKVFSEFGAPDKPALAVALFQKDKLIYERAFGNANLEHKIPANVDTKFQVDSLAWEFIAFSVLLLESQGKIKLSDNIATYLPELPDFGGQVTIDHLLSSTDGIYGYKVLQSLAGWEPKGPDQHKAILELVKQQKKLNFKPGTAFSPGGDTRFILLARIVELASGQPFDAFFKTNVFTPLGMKNTLFVYDESLPMDNTAVPYRQVAGGGYKNDAGPRNAAGPTNLYTSIRDLSIWRASLSAATLGGKALSSKLNAPIKLDRGQIIRDISSISTYGQQHAGQERGIAKTYQMGNSGGYASSIFRFPDHDIAVVVLSSGLDYNGSYGMRLASVLLKDDFLEPLTIDYSKIAGVKLSPEQLRGYEGHYWSPVWALAAGVKLDQGVLFYSRVGGAQNRELIPLGDGLFRMKIEGDDHYFLRFVDTKDGKRMHFIMGQSDPVVFEAYRPTAYTDKELAQFAGTFHCEELNSSFVVTVGKGILTANNLRTGAVDVRPIEGDLFSGNKPFLAGIRFKRGNNDAITGFEVVVDQVRNLAFKKITP